VIAAAALLCAAAGATVALTTSSSATAGHVATDSSAPTASPPAGGGSNARSGPAAGGAVGTVGSLSPSGFTMTTPTGQAVTVDEASTTTYRNGTAPTSASAITAGETVLVLGTTSSTTITATQVVEQPIGASGSPGGAVVPFTSGAPTTTQQVGQIPANYSEGSGTIVSGTTANQATEAALAAYPGPVVDRVVQLSNGEYEVHTIGVNWPHHVFEDAAFSVVGAE
jgi:hypothetical protein